MALIAGAHRPLPPGQRWKSNAAVQKELQVGKLEDVRLRHVAKAARLAFVLAVLQSGAAATWRSAVLEDMECMYWLYAPTLDELGSLTNARKTKVPSRECSRGAEASSSVRARRRVPTLPRQLPLQGTGDGASGKGCEELQGGLDGRPAGGAHGGGAQRGGS